jgi:YidC/Oxa1 family membrane protein insertase
MEQTRLLIALALSFLVFFIWSITFAPKPAVQEREPQQQTAEKEATEAARDSRANGAEREGDRAAEVARTPGVETDREPRNITIDSPLYRMVISERGAAVTSMVLKNYQETAHKDSRLKELIPPALAGGTALLSVDGVESNELATGVYTAEASTENISVQGRPVDVRFSYQTAEDVRVEKIYRFQPESYLIDLIVTVRNGSQKALGRGITLTLRDAVDEGAGGYYAFNGPSGLVNNKLEQIEIKKIPENNQIDGTIRWIAIEQPYFMKSIISKLPVEGRMVLARENQILENRIVHNFGDIGPSDQRTFEYGIFMGPKSLSILRSTQSDLDRIIDFGWVDFIAKPCLWFMNFIYGFIPNYGIAIIILTIVTRLLFWPLAQKSYKSMNDMRKLQPLMAEIREKYKNDKAKINQEMMGLYRTYKINPLGGCLPMLIQLPVFFALYRMLYQAIELRHAPFVGWIDDLSAPDRLFDFGFTIPLMQAPYGIPVLTLIMGASMLLQQKMAPAPGDPMQAKMMMLMPIVFTFIFINFPSGLVLYWLVSNIVSIAQQYYTQKRLA